MTSVIQIRRGRKAKNTDHEGPIHRAILAYLRLALPGAVIHHSASEFGISGPEIARQIAKNRNNGMLVGFPDLIVLWQGQFWAFEVKAPGGSLSSAQCQVGAEIMVNGGKWAVVRSVTEAEQLVKQWAAAMPVQSIPLRGTIT